MNACCFGQSSFAIYKFSLRIYLLWIDLCVFGVVDIKTQANYQLMDDNFVGLIFSCFNEDPQDKVFHIWITLYLYNWYSLFVDPSNQLGLHNLFT